MQKPEWFSFLFLPLPSALSSVLTSPFAQKKFTGLGKESSVTFGVPEREIFSPCYNQTLHNRPLLGRGDNFKLII